MRVIAGIAKGRRLIGPKSDKIRPALDKVKQAVFNILGDITGCRILDLFAGTGSIGIEALSQGASHAVFVDDGPESLKIVRKNLEICRFEGRATVLKMKIPEELDRIKKKEAGFDLVFVDPPYDRNLVNPTLQKLFSSGLLSPQGWVIVEHSPRELIQENQAWMIKSRREYGQTLISFLK